MTRPFLPGSRCVGARVKSAAPEFPRGDDPRRPGPCAEGRQRCALRRNLCQPNQRPSHPDHGQIADGIILSHVRCLERQNLFLRGCIHHQFLAFSSPSPKNAPRYGPRHDVYFGWIGAQNTHGPHLSRGRQPRPAPAERRLRTDDEIPASYVAGRR